MTGQSVRLRRGAAGLATLYAAPRVTSGPPIGRSVGPGTNDASGRPGGPATRPPFRNPLPWRGAVLPADGKKPPADRRHGPASDAAGRLAPSAPILLRCWEYTAGHRSVSRPRVRGPCCLRRVAIGARHALNRRAFLRATRRAIRRSRAVRPLGKAGPARFRSFATRAACGQAFPPTRSAMSMAPDGSPPTDASRPYGSTLVTRDGCCRQSGFDA